MSLKVEPKFPSRRTYVVKLRGDATPAALGGRIENLVTCQQYDFSSGRELLDLISREIGSQTPETGDQG